VSHAALRQHRPLLLGTEPGRVPPALHGRGPVAPLLAQSRSLTWRLACRPGAMPGPCGWGPGRRHCQARCLGRYRGLRRGRGGQQAGHWHPSSSSPHGWNKRVLGVPFSWLFCILTFPGWEGSHAGRSQMRLIKFHNRIVEVGPAGVEEGR